MVVLRTKIFRLFLDVAMVACVAAMAISLNGGWQGELFGIVHVSVHKLMRPISIFFGLLFLRLWISAPPGFKVGERLDYLLDCGRRFGRRLLYTAAGKPKRAAYVIFRPVGNDIDGLKLQWRSKRMIVTLSVILIVFLTLMPTYRYLNCGSLGDFAIYIDGMHSAIEGKLFENGIQFRQFNDIETVANSSYPKVSSFASHFRPILFLMVPFFRLVPHAVTLFFVQAVVIGFSVWPFYRLAGVFLKREDYALGLAVCYCVYPSVVSTSRSFFPGLISITFLMWAFWLYQQKRYLWMCFCLLLALSCKELMGLAVLSFGGYVFLIGRQRVMGVIIAAAGLLWLYVCLHWIIPQFTPGGKYQWMVLYPNFGDSLTSIIWGIISRPDNVLRHLFSFSAMRYLLGLLLPVAFLPLVGWRIWLMTLPILMQNLLTGQPGEIWYRMPGGLWSAPIVPFTFIAVLWALRELKEKRGERFVRRAIVVVFMASMLSLSFAEVRSWKSQEHINLLRKVQELVKDGEIVVSYKTLDYRLVGKYDWRVFPNRLDESDYIVVDSWLGQSPKDKVYFEKLKDDENFVEVWSERDDHLQIIFAIYKSKK